MNFPKQTFHLERGDLKFEGDKITITDNAKKKSRTTFFISGLWTLYGILSVFRYLKTGDEFLLWTGLIIGLGHGIVIVGTLFRSVQSEINLNEVKSIKIKQRFSNEFLDIKLKNNRIRRVSQIDQMGDLEEYIEAHLNLSKSGGFTLPA